ncbi:MAG: hypothetical protein JNK02_05020 [Planctomycetes bacterium]|nr:hypothetical protein [Planctomycetota bacterium]
MSDLPIHLLLFALMGVGIVVLASFYSEPEDCKALAAIPRRFVAFVIGCGIVALLLVLAQYTVASVR